MVELVMRMKQWKGRANAPLILEVGVSPIKQVATSVTNEHRFLIGNATCQKASFKVSARDYARLVDERQHTEIDR